MEKQVIDEVAETRKAKGREQIRKMSESIDEYHSHVKAFVKGIADSGKFLKLFSEYTHGLGEARSDEADKLLLDNIVFARKKCAALTAGLENAEKSLALAKELAEEIKRVEIDSGLVVAEPPDSLESIRQDLIAAFEDESNIPSEKVDAPPPRSEDDDKPFEADGLI